MWKKCIHSDFFKLTIYIFHSFCVSTPLLFYCSLFFSWFSPFSKSPAGVCAGWKEINVWDVIYWSGAGGNLTSLSLGVPYPCLSPYILFKNVKKKKEFSFLSLQMFPPPSNLREPNCLFAPWDSCLSQTGKPWFSRLAWEELLGDVGRKTRAKLFLTPHKFKRKPVVCSQGGGRGGGGSTALCYSECQRGALWIPFRVIYPPSSPGDVLVLVFWHPSPLTVGSPDRESTVVNPSRTCFTRFVFLHHAMP